MDSNQTEKLAKKLKIDKRVKHNIILQGSSCTLEWAGASACGDASTRYY